MEILNILHNKKCIQALYVYNDETSSYQFQDDIELGDWKIARIIPFGGPKSSRYKYDYNNYLEFVITDVKGETRIIDYYYNKGDEEVIVAFNKYYNDDTAHRGIQLFLENYSAFQYCDWQEYDAYKIVKRIKEIISDTDMSNCDILEEIKSIIEY